jgi:hypothetical protein
LPILAPTGIAAPAGAESPDLRPPEILNTLSAGNDCGSKFDIRQDVHVSKDQKSHSAQPVPNIASQDVLQDTSQECGFAATKMASCLPF